MKNNHKQKVFVAAKMQGDRKALPLKAEYLPMRKVRAENGTSDYSIKGFPAKVQDSNIQKVCAAAKVKNNHKQKVFVAAKMQGDRKALPLKAV